MSTLLQFLSPDVNEDILSELDRGITDHIAWLQRWHRALLCQMASDPDDLDADGHLRCQFGGWYTENHSHGLINQPAFRALGKVHREMHEQARRLAVRAAAGESMDRAGYDYFMGRVLAFNSQSRRLERAFRKAFSDLDPLTGLYNRQAMMSELHRERERFMRTGQPCSIGLCDIDFFKKVNDTYGHLAGDHVLFGVADCFTRRLRPFDLIFRYGGEEFLFCLPNADAIAAGAILDRLRSDLESTPIQLDDGQELAVTASFGVAEIAVDTSNEEAIARADKALYEAKHSGRNRTRVWSPGSEGA